MSDRSIRQPDELPDVKNPRKVPFVELHDGRLHGVVSSGSSRERVYLCFVEAGTGDYHCRTNNDRRCSSLSRGEAGCKHLDSLFDAAIRRHGHDRVVEYLEVSEGDEPGDGSPPERLSALLRSLDGSEREEQASEVFSRFLDSLRYLELDGTREPAPEMSWFLS